MDLIFMVLVAGAVAVGFLGAALIDKTLFRPVYQYTLKQTSRGRWRINLRDAEGDSILVTSGAGFKTRAEAEAVMEGLRGAKLVDVDIDQELQGC